MDQVKSVTDGLLLHRRSYVYIEAKNASCSNIVTVVAVACLPAYPTILHQCQLQLVKGTQGIDAARICLLIHQRYECNNAHFEKNIFTYLYCFACDA